MLKSSSEPEIAEQGDACLNCQTALKGAYCHYCGQKKIAHEHGFIQTIIHFLGDFVHFDTLIFRTIIPLIFRPGFLVREHFAGKRVRYLDPVKMYVFLSLLFFTLFHFTGNESQELKVNSSSEIDAALKDQPQEVKKLVEQRIPDDLKLTPDDESYENAAEYETYQASLPEAQRDGPLAQWLIRKGLNVQDRLNEDKISFASLLSENFEKNLPKFVFILLPLAALLLYLLYLRKKVAYVHHFLFTLQWYNAIFLISSLLIAVHLIFHVKSVSTIGIWITMIYLFFAMKNVYRQSLLKTFVKFSLFGIGMFLLLLIATAVNLLISIGMM